MKRYPILGALLLVLVLVVLLVSPLSAQVRQPFEWIFAKRLTVETTTALGGATTIGGALTGTSAAFSGNVTGGGTLSVAGDLAASDALYLIPGTAITVTNGGTITPTTAVQELTAAGNVGAELAACGDGQVLHLVNLSNVTITITDTGTIRLEGNAALGQYDTLTVVGNGVSCIELARANN